MAAIERHRPHRPDPVAWVLHAGMLLSFLGVWITAEWPGLRGWHIAWGHALAAFFLARVMRSLQRPHASLTRWWWTAWASVRRLRRGHESLLRPATWSVAGGAVLVCAILILVPTSFASGWVLGRLVDESGGPSGWHRGLGHALMWVVASHIALAGLLRVLRGRRHPGQGAAG